MTDKNIQWERHKGGLNEMWLLREYRVDKNHHPQMHSVVLGSARKVKNNHRCRVWAVKYEGLVYDEHLATLKDMERPEALAAAKLLILLRLKDEPR